MAFQRQAQLIQVSYIAREKGLKGGRHSALMVIIKGLGWSVYARKASVISR
jgi:hypothetical protein